MSRPEINFIQSQSLAWDNQRLAIRPEVEVKPLSRNASTGALSALMRYPAGWRHTMPQALNTAEEIYVLRGNLEVAGISYGPHSYAYLPAGYLRTLMQTDEETVVLAFFRRAPAEAVLIEAGENFREADLVSHIDVHGLAADNASQLNTLLRHDTRTGEQTWISTIRPLWQTQNSAAHTTDVETFLLSGTLSGPKGRQMPGAYSFLPAGRPHGPYASLDGAMQICRSLEGPLESRSRPGLLKWDAPYAPKLPDSLQKQAKGYDKIAVAYDAFLEVVPIIRKR